MNDTSRFWVIFDTCTVHHYYQDVHNLLAYPAGSIIRYEYRDQWLSTEALRASSNPKTAPANILLVYAQWKEYNKGEPPPSSSTPNDEMCWVATRIAKLQNVLPEGNECHFDFIVLGYPKQDDDVIMKILRPLIERNEVPYHKWVALSDDINTLNSLNRGSDAENWQSIVESLSKPPIQLVGNSFWRLKEPFRGRVGRSIKPTYSEEKVSLVESTEVRKVTSIYDLSESDTVGLEFISYTPINVAGKDAGLNRRVGIIYSEDGPLELITESSFNIRSYRSEIVKVRAHHSDKLDERTALIQFNTLPPEGDWPVGPQVTLQFRINKKGWELFLSILFLLLGGFLLFVAGKIWEDNSIGALIALIIGFLFLIAKELIISRKIPSKL